MSAFQSQVAKILAFAPRGNFATLTTRDRMDVTEWRDQAKRFGYDRLVIHERHDTDPPDVQSFLTVYRRGEPWSRWGIARRGGTVLAWCCVSGHDFGGYNSVAEALLALLPPENPIPSAATKVSPLMEAGVRGVAHPPVFPFTPR